MGGSRKSFDGLRVLVIHSGGDSKRVPQYSALGKLFSPVPHELPDGRSSTLFDEFMICMSSMPSRIREGMVLLSGDVLLLFNPLQIDYNNVGAAAISFKEHVDTGKNHGVYLNGENGEVKCCLQKKSVDMLREVGAVNEQDCVDIDTGALIFSTEMMDTLDCFKGILIVLVVVRHVLQYSVSDEGGILTNVIWAIQMPGFILISGYFAAKPNKSICKQVIKNSQRYFLPFISWWILISVLLLGACGRSLQIGINKLIYHVDGGLWFLWVVFVLSILASIINKIFSTDFKLMKKISSAVMVGCVFYSVLFVIAFFTHDINILGIKLILYYSVFYECGYLLKWTEKIWKSKWYKYKNVVVFFSLALFLTIVYNYDLYHCDDNILSIALRMVAGFTGNIVLYNTIDKFKNIINKIELVYWLIDI